MENSFTYVSKTGENYTTKLSRTCWVEFMESIPVRLMTVYVSVGFAEEFFEKERIREGLLSQS